MIENPIEATLLMFVVERCKKLGITLSLSPKTYVVSGESKCSGYFDYENKVLAVALGFKDWKTTLLHEYSHMCQWEENSKEWRNYENTEKNQEYDLDDYLAGKPVPVKHVDAIIKKTIALEVDCERRVVGLLEAFGFSEKSISEYKQKANAYALFYHQMKKHKKWYAPKSAPYKVKKFWSQMPADLYIDHLSKKSIKLSEKLKGCLSN